MKDPYSHKQKTVPIIFMKTNAHHPILVFLFFFCYLILGISIHNDYGISWDEPAQRIIGAVNVKYIFPDIFPEKLSSVPDLHDIKDKDYGVIFEVPAFLLESILDLQSPLDIFAFRHLITFLFSLSGSLAIFHIAKTRYDSHLWGLLCVSLLVFSPRFFAESFFNCKDIVFMASFATAMATMFMMIRHRNVQNVLMHSIMTAIAIDIRIMGISLLFTTLGLLCMIMIKKEEEVPKTIQLGAFYIILTGILIIALFPFLWEHPIHNFIQVFENMARFRWKGDLLYHGDVVLSTELPWHYLPSWIAITTPPLFLLFYLVGVFASLRDVQSTSYRLWENEKGMIDVVCLILSAGVITLLIAIKPVLYDGWRHAYFIYPAFLIIVMRGIHYSWLSCQRFNQIRYLIPILLTLTFLYTGYWMKRAHPLQNVYFNMFARTPWYDNYDLDYWGLGNRDVLQWIADHDKRKNISITPVSIVPLEYSLELLQEDARSRFVIVPKETNPDYLFTNYRMVKNRRNDKYLPDYMLYYQKMIDNEVIISVFKKVGTQESSIHE